MRVIIRRAVIAVVGALAVLWPAAARAELVRFTTGRVMSVASCRFDGDTIVMTLREGGEIRAPRAVVADVTPDEFDHSVKPEAPAAPRAIEIPRVPPDAIHALVDRLAAELGVPNKLAHAVVQIESNYEPNAVSREGAMGLMQIMPDVAKDYAVKNPFDPEQNLTAGLRLLKDLTTRFGLETGLAAYNAGEGAVTRYGGIPPYRETKDYVKSILALVQHP
jgi:soluble lytic murein transglycosylase-like protein